MTASRTPRVPAIDALKGCAVLWVLLIHSDALGPRPVFAHLVNHAVPLFVILFGTNSTFWWRRRALPADLGLWFTSRAKRILMPYWATLPVWWFLALYYRPFGVLFPRWLPAAHLAGYTVYIGTGWFVTLVLQLVVWFPLVEVGRRRLGVSLLLVAAALVAAISTAARWHIIDFVPETWFGFRLFNFLVFSPRFALHVAFGVWLAERVDVLRPAVGVFACALYLACVTALQQQWAPGWDTYTSALMDLPLCVALLVALAPVAVAPVVGPALAWLGQSSYGIYLGQMLTHNAFTFHFGLRDLPVRVDPWLYTGILLAGGIGAVLVGEQLLRVNAALRARGWPLPDLAR